MRPASPISIIQLSNSRADVPSATKRLHLYRSLSYQALSSPHLYSISSFFPKSNPKIANHLHFPKNNAKIPSLTVSNRKNRCIPYIYWAVAIFSVVTNYSNLFFSFTFFLNCFHFAFGYELVISSKATDLMKIVCDSFTFV